MLKSALPMGAAALLLGLAACSQGPNEEAGEGADTAYEQSTSGVTDPGQGPQEEAGEAMDEAAEGRPPGNTTSQQPTTPPPTAPITASWCTR